jgi:hypothetical protein
LAKDLKDTTVIILTVAACSTALVAGVISVYKPVIKLWHRYSPHVGNLLHRSKDATVDAWDQASLLYRVPSNTIGFLLLEYIVLWLTVGTAGKGLGGLSISSFFSLWLGVIAGLDSILGIIGFVGIVCSTVFGVHQDLPEHRIKTLAAVGLFGVILGLGLRFD